MTFLSLDAQAKIITATKHIIFMYKKSSYYLQSFDTVLHMHHKC